MTFSPQLWIETYLSFLASPLGMVIFICIYALWVSALLPGSWLTMLAGLTYGLWIGSVLVFIGACIGAQITFFLGRTFLRNWAQYKLSSYPKVKAIETSVVKEGLKLIFLTRLSPVFPFSLLNLVYGISKVSPRDFTVGLLGILPGTILYCSFGTLAGEVANFSEILSKKDDINSVLFNLIGIVSTLIIVWLISRSAREILQKYD